MCIGTLEECSTAQGGTLAVRRCAGQGAGPTVKDTTAGTSRATTHERTVALTVHHAEAPVRKTKEATMRRAFAGLLLVSSAGLLVAHDELGASSHREAPFITSLPKVDGTDFYMFRSYEPGREEFVTLVANYYPFQDPYGGPNYYALDPEALYEIHIDNDGDAVEDLTFRFQFDKELREEDGLELMVGEGDDARSIAIPLINLGPITAENEENLNRLETYSVDLVRGDRRTGDVVSISEIGGDATFEKPVDFIGTKSLPDYEAYARAHTYSIDIPDCGVSSTHRAGQSSEARLFVGQREESFVVALGELFDLINLDPLGDRDRGLDDLEDENITSIALEVPISCLTQGGSPVIGGWTTASLRQARVLNPRPTFEQPTREGGAFTQVSRLGNPLVNEIVIGLRDKNLFNASEPAEDEQFLEYVTHPTFPEIVEILFGSAGVVAPDLFPREDLVAVFLTGVEGVNMTATPAEMLRLNTAIPPTPPEGQNSLGALECFVDGKLDLEAAGCDPAGFPNGRRPGDDVVDIELRVAMGALLPESVAPAGDLPYNDGALITSGDFQDEFPYLRTPIPGSRP